MDHCEYHGPKCCGNKRDGTKCGSRATAQFNWLYCREDHVPFLPTSTPTDVFRCEDLRTTRGNIVKEYRSHRDVYTDRSIKPSYEIDHVVELHLVRDAFDKVKPKGTSVRAQKECLRDTLKVAANAMENLAYTSPSINNRKFKAIYAFQEDYRDNKGLQSEQGLFPYLQEDGRLSRSVSRNIQKELLASSDKFVEALRDEDPLQAQVMDSIDRNFTAMKLY